MAFAVEFRMAASTLQWYRFHVLTAGAFLRSRFRVRRGSKHAPTFTAREPAQSGEQPGFGFSKDSQPMGGVRATSDAPASARSEEARRRRDIVRESVIRTSRSGQSVGDEG